MNSANPAVSVCLPVYNGQMYVQQTIDSILNQSFTDFELILADNASTDQTPDIFRDVERRDTRARYLGADENRGLAWNFNRAFQEARGEFVVWIGYDDLMAPTLLAASVEQLRADPAAVLVYARTRYIDDDGQTSGMVDTAPSGTADEAAARLEQILFDAMCHPIVGLMRRSTLLETHLHLPYADSDRVLLAELGLRGKFLYLDEPLYSRRIHRGQTTRLFDDRWARTLIFDPRQKGQMLCPWLREIKDLLLAVHRSPLSRRAKWQCYKRVRWWMAAHRQFITEDAWRGFRHWFPSRRQCTPAPLAPTISSRT